MNKNQKQHIQYMNNINSLIAIFPASFLSKSLKAV